MTTHIKFNYGGTEYNFVVQVDKSQRLEMPTSDKMFVVSIEMHKNIINVYHVSEEFFEANALVHTQPIKKAVVRASAFMDFYLDEETLEFLMTDIQRYLSRNGKITLTAFDLFINCAYIPKSVCYNIMEDLEEYEADDLLFLDDYQEKPIYMML